MDDQGSEVIVRRATAADAEAIAAIGRVAWPATYATLVPEAIIRDVVEQTYNTAALERAIAANDRSSGAHFLVAELGGRVIGFLDYSEVPEPELHRIYVDPAQTGGGIGGRLLAALHERLAPGTSYVLMVAADNRGAVRFYERNGFVRDAEVDVSPTTASTWASPFRPIRWGSPASSSGGASDSLLIVTRTGTDRHKSIQTQ